MAVDNTPRIAPKVMPDTPEELLTFVSWPEKYLDESDEEFAARQSLCKVLGQRYADHMRKKYGSLLTPKVSKVWTPRI
jgi:hypothetical protein